MRRAQKRLLIADVLMFWCSHVAGATLACGLALDLLDLGAAALTESGMASGLLRLAVGLRLRPSPVALRPSDLAGQAPDPLTLKQNRRRRAGCNVSLPRSANWVSVGAWRPTVN